MPEDSTALVLTGISTKESTPTNRRNGKRGKSRSAWSVMITCGPLILTTSRHCPRTNFATHAGRSGVVTTCQIPTMTSKRGSRSFRGRASGRPAIQRSTQGDDHG